MYYHQSGHFYNSNTKHVFIFLDVALLAKEESPKCFTRNLEDFTCFWEALEGKTYEFFYRTDDEESRCNVSEQESKDGRILLVCFFPASDVFLFTSTQLRVVDTHTNTTVYSRTVDVEKKLLLDPPLNVSLDLTGEARQLLVKWKATKEFEKHLQYEIQYRSASQDTAILVKTSRCEHKLLSLVPGDTYTVRMRLKPNSSSIKGHWSDWSSSVTAMVPQPADHIELKCHTPDLHQVQCRWNEELYGHGNYSLHYRQTNRYDGERHCLRWNSPLPLISQHLIYQIRYQLRGESEWKLFTVPSPKTRVCLDAQVGSEYSIQVKAMPNGSLYSGHWSAWSRCLIVQLPSNTGWLFITCVPFSLLIISIVMFSLFSRHVSKLKQFLWPPVPNLNEVLENFLKDINGQHWEPNFSTKLCDDDIAASVVEIMSEGDAHVMKKPTNCPHFPQHGSLAWDSNGECALDGLEVNREYVTLNTVLPCLTGNDYVYKVNSSSGQGGEKLSSAYYTTFSISTTNIFNHSYVQAGEGEAQIPVHHYTNLEQTDITAKIE
uniref:Fibronectin type-III domain-containing protein n=1 Tax=Pygocentrus nattereri TaxID=42514 RepID=A0AAR2K6S1_PYGNA